jgi:hypothetical protein
MVPGNACEGVVEKRSFPSYDLKETLMLPHVLSRGLLLYSSLIGVDIKRDQYVA